MKIYKVHPADIYADRDPIMHKEVVLREDADKRIAALEAENDENVLILRRELAVCMDALSELPDEMLGQIPEGRLVLALKAMEDSKKTRDVRCFVDGIIAERDTFKAQLDALVEAALPFHEWFESRTEVYRKRGGVPQSILDSTVTEAPPFTMGEFRKLRSAINEALSEGGA